MGWRLKTYDDAICAGDAPILEHRADDWRKGLRAQCPECGCWRPAEALIDMRAAPAKVTNGHAFLCDGCLARRELEGMTLDDGRRFSEARLFEMLGAPAEIVAERDAVDLARRARVALSAGQR